MTAPWLIRVASHPRHGGGHLARCTVLAEALRETGAAVTVVLDGDTPQTIAARFSSRGVSAVTAHRLGDGPWAGCVLDGYEILHEEAPRWRAAAAPLVVIDDFLAPPEGAVLVINGAIHLEGDRVDGIPALLGPAYALVDPRYAALPPRERSAPVEHIVVSFGKLDPDNMTGVTLQALSGLAAAPQVTVLAGSGTPHLSTLREQVSAQGDRFRLLVHEADMLPHLAEADLAIGAGGVSLLERLAAGVPSVTLSLIDNQDLAVEGAVSMGVTIGAGAAGSVTVDGLRTVLTTAMSDGALRCRIATAARHQVDGAGAMRIAAELIQLVERQDRVLEANGDE